MNARFKLLFLSANPAGTQLLRTDQELRDVDARIRAALAPDRFEIVVATAARRDQLLRQMLEHCPDIVHFSGHGDSKRGIILEDQHGRAAPVGGASLASLFSIVRGKPSIVVLNACSTKRTARAFRNVVDYTIAMNGPIRDISAIAFASAFYDALARGLHVPAAFGAGLSQLQLLKLPSKTTPELFVAPGVRLESEPQTAPKHDPVHSGSLVSVSGRSKVRDISVISGSNNRFVKGSRR